MNKRNADFIKLFIQNHFFVSGVYIANRLLEEFSPRNIL